MINKLQDKRRSFGDTSAIGEACTAAIDKLDAYYTLATNQRSSHSVVATICDPRLNYNVFEILWKTSGEKVKRTRAKAQFEDCFHKYKERENELQKENILAAIDAEEEGQQQKEPESDSEDHLYVAQGISALESEWKMWIKEPLAPRETDILKYWQGKQYQYPIIAKIARDHLAIPSTSAASESVFSIGGDIVTKARNRLLPSTVRYLLCLRNWGIITQAQDSDSDIEG
jgi:hypothetical protein